MITENTNIEAFAIHMVGSKAEDEGYSLSKSVMEVDDEMKEILRDYFLLSFKSDELYNFYHDSELSYNEVCDYVAKIFDDSSQASVRKKFASQHQVGRILCGALPRLRGRWRDC